MIDLVDVIVEVKHRPRGTQVTTSSESGDVNTFYREIKLRHPSIPTAVSLWSLDEGQRIRLRFCPPKVLQGHNLFGIDDARLLISKCAPRLLRLAGIRANKKELRRILNGSVEIGEVHIAYNFVLPPGLIPALIDRTIRSAPRAWKVKRLERGTGFTIFTGSRNRYWLFYDKGEEFVSRGKKYFTARLASSNGAFEKIGWHVDRERLVTHSRNVLRVELRLLDRYLQVPSRRLTTSKSWSSELPLELYFAELKKLHFPRSIRASRIDAMVASAPRHLRAALIAWKSGYEPQDVLPHRTFYRQRTEILRRWKLDIARRRLRASTCADVSWRTLLRRKNILNAPSWAVGTRLLYLGTPRE